MDIISDIILFLFVGAIIWWTSSIKSSLESMEHSLNNIYSEILTKTNETVDLMTIETKLDDINDNLEKINDELSQIETNTDK